MRILLSRVYIRIPHLGVKERGITDKRGTGNSDQENGRASARWSFPTACVRGSHVCVYAACAYVNVCVSISMTYMYTHIYMDGCGHTYIHAYMHVYIHACIHRQTYIDRQTDRQTDRH